MAKILPTGTLLQTDEGGFLISEANVNKIVSPWKEAIEEIKNTYLTHFNDAVHSIYVRGTVSRGIAIEKVSDLDTFSIILKNPNHMNLDHFMEARKNLEKKFSFSTGVDVGFIYHPELLDKNNILFNTNRSFNNRFIIKTQSACIYGKDLAEQIPRFKPDATTIKHLYINLSAVFKTVEEQIAYSSCKKEIKFWCTWIMKIIIRAGFLLVIEKEKTFTRDLYPCYICFSKYFPDQRHKMKIALELAINPTDSSLKIRAFLEDFGKWIYTKIEKLFDDLL